MKASDDDAKILSDLGYKQELYRGFDGFMSFAFCFTAVSVIPSISLGLNTSVYLGGPAEVVWAWVVASFFCTIAGCSMAEICSVYPSAGSVYHWAGQLSSPKYAPASAYICGWFNFLGNAAGDAAFASGFATTLSYCLAIASPGSDLSVESQVWISIVVLLSWAIADLLRTDAQGVWNDFAVVVQMGGAVVIVISLLVLAGLNGQRATGEYVFTSGYDGVDLNTPAADLYAGMKVSSYTVVMGVTSALFAFTGYEAGAHMAEETVNARQAAPRGVVATVACCAIFGFMYIIGLIFAVPDVTALDVDAIQGIFEGAAGQRGGLGLMIVLLCMFYMAGLASTTVTSRIIFALARDGALPGSRSIRYVLPHTKAPLGSVCLVFFVDGLFMLLPLINSSALAAITGTCTVGFQVSYAIPILMRCTVGRADWKPGVWNLGRLSYPFALVSGVWQILSSILFFLPYAFPVSVDNVNWTVVVVGGMLLISGLNWFLSARHTFTGPTRVTPSDTRLSM